MARLPRELGRKRIGRFATEEEAHRVLAAYLADLVERPEQIVTVEEWGRRWLDQREAKGHHRGVEAERSRWRCYVEGTALGRLAIGDVREIDAQRWLDGLSTEERPLAAQTQQNALTLLRGALEAARKAGHLRSNPAAPVRLPKGARARTDEGWTWLRPVELEALLGAVASDLERGSAIVVAVFTGLRAGELWGLRWQDVDLERRVLSVRHSYTQPTKSGRPREVPLLDPAVDALRVWRAASERRSPRGLVWPAQDGRCRSRGYDARLADFLERAGIERRVRFHDLRHTCASLLVQGAWVPELLERPLRLEEVKEWLGHSDIGVTQRYAHLCADGLRSVVVENGPRVGPQGGVPAAIRTRDLRFRKASRSRTNERESGDPGPVAGHSVGQLARTFLAAVEARDPYALHRGIDLAEAVIADEASDAHPRASVERREQTP